MAAITRTSRTASHTSTRAPSPWPSSRSRSTTITSGAARRAATPGTNGPSTRSREPRPHASRRLSTSRIWSSTTETRMRSSIPQHHRLLWLGSERGCGSRASDADWWGERTCRQPPRGSVQPLPTPARPQPRGLVPLGGGRLRQGPRRGPPRVPLRGLRRVPLVPRDGARVLRGRGHRGVPERAVRGDQGRS